MNAKGQSGGPNWFLISLLLALAIGALMLIILWTRGFEPADTALREVAGCSGPSALIGWGECIPRTECDARWLYGWSNVGVLSCDKEGYSCCILPSMEEKKWYKPGSFIIRYKGQNRLFFPQLAQRNDVGKQTGLLIDASSKEAKAESLILIYLPRRDVKLYEEGKRVEVKDDLCTLGIHPGGLVGRVDDCFDTGDEYGGDFDEVYLWQGTVGGFIEKFPAKGKLTFQLDIETDDPDGRGQKTLTYEEIIEFRQ